MADLSYDPDTMAQHDRYKLLISLVIPRPIALVTTVGPTGVVNAAPFSFFNIFSEHPPLVRARPAGARPDGGLKDTSAHIRERGAFVVNLVDEALGAQMNMCAIDFPPEISEIDAAKLSLLPSEKVKIAAHRRGAGRARMPPLHHAGGERAAPPRDRRDRARPCARRAVGHREDAHRHDAVSPARAPLRQFLRVARRAVRPRAAELRGMGGGAEEVSRHSEPHPEERAKRASRRMATRTAGHGSRRVAARRSSP